MVGGLISAGASILGGMMANSSNQDIANMNNATSVDIAKNGMQYKVADLKAAGLNPALAYSSGPINMPNLSTPVMQNSAAHAGEAFGAYQQSQVAKAQIEALQSQADLNSAQAGRTRLASMSDGIDLVKSQSDLNAQSAGSSFGTLSADVGRQQSFLDMYNVNRDSNTARYLDDFAVSKGYRNFPELMGSVQGRQALTDLNLSNLQVPEAKAMAGMWGSKYGVNIAPYVQSASQAAGPIGGALGYMIGRGSRAGASINSAVNATKIDPTIGSLRKVK